MEDPIPGGSENHSRATSSRPESYSRTQAPTHDVTSFSGETSIAHNLTVVEDRLEQMGIQYERMRSPPPTHPLWRRLIDPQLESSETKGAHRVQTTYILLCLANGRCVESSRFEDDQGPYSAGGSLYSAAREIYGDLLEGFQQFPDQILVLQTVVLMVRMKTRDFSRIELILFKSEQVVYLFRIDAHGPAEKMLALSISHAHHLGLQRNRIVEKMSPFQSEMARRIW